MRNGVMKYYMLFFVAILITSCNSYSDRSTICLNDLKNSKQIVDTDDLFEFTYIPLEYKSECPIINIDPLAELN